MLNSLQSKVLRSGSEFLMIPLVTSTVLISLGLNQNQIAIARQEQQKLQGFQNNQTSLSSLTKQQQPTGISFEINNIGEDVSI